MVGVQIRTDLRMDARGTLTLLAGLEVTTMHAVHVGTGTTKVAEITLEAIHLYHLFHLVQNALL